MVLFIDDFEKSLLPSEQMGTLLEKVNSKYLNIFILANNIFEFDDLFVTNKKLISSPANYKRMAILQFGFDLRSQLVHRWNLISDEKLTDEERLRKDDDYGKKMNSLIRDGNIVSAFPIFLLTILLAIETENTQNLELRWSPKTGQVVKIESCS